MRYTVGNEYLFISIDFTDKIEERSFSRLFIPWMHNLKSINTLRLKCESHHKVAWEQGGEKKYDGFIFKDRCGVQYNNQYPNASYGQLDDSANWCVAKDIGWTEGVDVKKLPEWLADELMFSPYTDARKFLKNAYNAIHGKLAVFKDANEIAQFERYINMLVLAVNMAGYQVEFVPFETKKTDGTVIVMDNYYDARLTQGAYRTGERSRS